MLLVWLLVGAVSALTTATPSSSAAASASAAASSSSVSSSVVKHDGRCEEITIPMCRGIGYNWTSMPNSLHHDSQEEAGLEVHQFWPLVEIHCSPDLRFFLCSIYAPICLKDYPNSIPACKSVCLRAEAGCAPLMRKYGFAWPERMQCDKFPQYGDPHNICMDERNGTLPAPTAMTPVDLPVPGLGGGVDGKKPPPPVVPSVFPKLCKGPNKRQCITDDSGADQNDCQCQCRPPLIQLNSGDPRFNRSLSVGDVSNCLLPCSNPFFSEDEQWFASLWVALWAAIAALSSALTFATFLIDRPRFRYPERPLIFLSACYVGLSVGYLVRIAVGGRHVVACDGNAIRYGAAPPNFGAGVVPGVNSSSTSSPLCVVTFLLVYFFGQAAGLWWVILSLTWFLAAGRKWGSEAIARCAPYFHLVAWTLPAVQTAAALLMAAVDGDSLAGVCHVGVQQPWLLRWLLLFPLGLHLLLGGGFLLAGLAGLARIRRVLKAQGRPKAEKLEKLMIRIGIFSVLYSVPAAILLGCYAYEVAFQQEWGRTLTCSGCASQSEQIGLRSALSHRPDFSIFMLKYFMTLVVGITSGFWVWSHKTVNSWRKFYCRLFRRRSSVPAVTPQHHQQQLDHHQHQHQQLLVPPIPPLPNAAHSKSSLIKQPLMQSVQSHLGSTYKAPPLSHV